MSYNPATDFPGMLRLIGSSLRSERVPGLNFVIDALARANIFNISIGQTAPTVNQATTMWFQPAIPSWIAEGTVWLWNSVAGVYQVATPALWAAFLLSNAQAAPARTITASGAFVMSTGDQSILLNRTLAVAASSTTLPAGSAVGQIYNIEDYAGNFNAHPVTINYPAGQTGPEGSVEEILSVNKQCARFRYYGGNLWSFKP